MNFETVLFAAAFLLLAILTLPQDDLAPTDQAETSEAAAFAAAPTKDAASAPTEFESDAEAAKDELSDVRND